MSGICINDFGALLYDRDNHNVSNKLFDSQTNSLTLKIVKGFSMERMKYYGTILLIFLMDGVFYLAAGTLLERWINSNFLIFFAAFVFISLFFAPIVSSLLLIKLPLPFSDRKKNIASIGGYLLMSLVLMLLVYHNWEAIIYMLIIGGISVFFHFRVHKLITSKGTALE